MQTVLVRVQVIVAIVLAALLAYPSVRALVAYEQMDALGLTGRGALLLFAAGIAARWQIALRVSAAILVLAALFLPIGVFNPFAAADGIELPSLAATLVWFIPVELCLLLAAWVLDLDLRKRAYHES